MENLFIIIPARLNSTRLSNKVLEKINGKSLVQHVWEKMKNFPNVLIATDAEKVVKEVRRFKGNVFLTKEQHINGTERYKVVKTWVTTGLTFNGKTEITTGLEEGMVIVDKGSRSVRTGQEVVLD